eukprot:COSAG02_NODE_8653_length_2485_cov_2.233054_2_plen_96_part_00
MALLLICVAGISGVFMHMRGGRGRGGREESAVPRARAREGAVTCGSSADLVNCVRAGPPNTSPILLAWDMKLLHSAALASFVAIARGMWAPTSPC